MGDTTPTLLEAEAVDDDVHFFRRLGEVLLRHEPGGQASKQLVIATARHCGWCLVSNRAGQLPALHFDAFVESQGLKGTPV